MHVRIIYDLWTTVLIFPLKDTNSDTFECGTNPCQNGAQCLNNEGSFICSCAGGWSGPLCDQGKVLTSLHAI